MKRKFWIIMVFILLLTGCAKSGNKTIEDAYFSLSIPANWLEYPLEDAIRYSDPDSGLIFKMEALERNTLGLEKTLEQIQGENKKRKITEMEHKEYTLEDYPCILSVYRIDESSVETHLLVQVEKDVIEDIYFGDIAPANYDKKVIQRVINTIKKVD
ncbi:MAG: hypothetical protein J6E46_02160 [Faecalicoccus sp.]|jgi:hypothetical protein|nr:hypothetical protein [Faecalicoccus sp.]